MDFCELGAVKKAHVVRLDGPPVMKWNRENKKGRDSVRTCFSDSLANPGKSSCRGRFFTLFRYREEKKAGGAGG